jgi:phosphoserine phosphatase SerB
LKRRVALLAGQPSSIIDKIKAKIEFTPGALELCKVLKALGFKLAVLSGGFMPLATFVKETLGLDYAFANNLEIKDGKLTGYTTGTIVNAEKKAELLAIISQFEGVSKEQVKVSFNLDNCCW